MSKRVWIKNPLDIYADNAKGGIVIEGTKIMELIPLGEEPSRRVDEVFDAKECVLLPGLINTHHHFYQTLTRAYPDALNKELFPWLTSLYKVWEHLDSDMIYHSTKLALSELLLSGCTTASDHHYVFSDQLEDAIDIQMEVAQELGMRVVLTRGSMSLGQKDGGLPPQSVVQDEQTILDDSIRLVKKYHKKEHGAMTQLALAPCSPFSVSTALMIESAKIAKEYDICLHTHLAETIDEEIQRLGAANVGICHCPTSNMMLSSGICKTLELEKAGAIIGLGVDGSASNDGSNMIEETRMAMYLQRLKYGSSKITHQKALRWATKGSAQVLRRDDIGEIAVGKEADIALFKLDEIQFSGSHDPLAALLLCGAHKANRVMIAGNWKVIDGEILNFDTKKIIYEHTNQSKRLYKKAN